MRSKNITIKIRYLSPEDFLIPCHIRENRGISRVTGILSKGVKTVETRILEIEDRTGLGKANVRRLRKTGAIPAVVYSDGKDAKSLSLNQYKFELAVRGAKPTQIYKFQGKGSSLNDVMAIIKSVQVEPVKGQMLHVDFVSISEDHELTVSVPLEIFGESAAIKENRAFLFQAVYEVEVECLPKNIPEVVKINISNLKEGGSLPASSVELPMGVKLKSQPTLTVVTAISKKALEEEQAKAMATATAAPAAAAAAAPGAAAPAAGATAAPGAAAPAAAAAKQPEKKK